MGYWLFYMLKGYEYVVILKYLDRETKVFEGFDRC